MRQLLLLLLVILVVVAAVDAGKKRKSKKHHKHHTHKHHTHKHHTHKHHTHKHSNSFSYSHQVSYQYQHDIHQNYKHELHCAKHCVPDHAYWKGDHCSCHSGLAGAGDLCCTDPHHYPYTCTVRGDPYVHSYMNQNAQVFNPCGQVLAVINAKTCSQQSCHVTIRSADAIEQGIFITNQVEVTLNIDGKSEFVIMNGTQYYNSLESKWEDLGNNYDKCFSIHGERVQILLDERRRVWTLNACGTIVNFRRDTRGGKPGVCISSEYPFSKRPCDHPQDIVCNRLEVDTFPYHSKATYYLAKSFKLKEYLNLKLTCAYHDTCKEVTTTFNSCRKSKRSKAINICSAILEKDFRSCDSLHGGSHGAGLFKKFAQCVDAFCKGDHNWCQEEKSKDMFIHCKIPKLDCCQFGAKKKPKNKHGGLVQQIKKQVLKNFFHKN